MGLRRRQGTVTSSPTEPSTSTPCIEVVAGGWLALSSSGPRDRAISVRIRQPLPAHVGDHDLARRFRRQREDQPASRPTRTSGRLLRRNAHDRGARAERAAARRRAAARPPALRDLHRSRSPATRPHRVTAIAITGKSQKSRRRPSRPADLSFVPDDGHRQRFPQPGGYFTLIQPPESPQRRRPVPVAPGLTASLTLVVADSSGRSGHGRARRCATSRCAPRHQRSGRPGIRAGLAVVSGRRTRSRIRGSCCRPPAQLLRPHHRRR